jgi:hypothetical protein
VFPKNNRRYSIGITNPVIVFVVSFVIVEPGRVTVLPGPVFVMVVVWPGLGSKVSYIQNIKLN